uniref:ATP synthase F0 subunit 8 n=1 Tax=Ramulus mikado TaxID=2823491 RepID=E2RUU7_9NEOP|nr:ATP synthase F0 subunit 8 [Ramulus irregulariterdentatus]BAJ24481.1 ATP synthase F0 subunit 8 [Ramulus irregulariterdentatus]
MPQMAPMSWMMLYMYFIMMLMIFIIKMYFNKEVMMKLKMNLKTIQLMNNWKW